MEKTLVLRSDGFRVTPRVEPPLPPTAAPAGISADQWQAAWDIGVWLEKCRFYRDADEPEPSFPLDVIDYFSV